MKIKLANLLTISIHKEGLNFVSISGILTFISLISTGLHTMTLMLFILTFLMVWFFRDPERVLPQKENIIVAPADGKIVSINESTLPSELKDESGKIYTKISIFLNVDDVHVQRIPITGTIKQVEYINGTFVNASLDKASTDNERNLIVIETENNDQIAVIQIAGLVARRIVSYAKIGDKFNIGDQYGIIKFGSRVDIYIPNAFQIETLVGQTMIGGETIMAVKK